MQHDEARKEITGILGNEIKFEGHFEACFDNLKESQQIEIIQWIISCKEMKENPIKSKKDKEIIGFVKRIGSNIRTLLTKKKGSYFIALFLDKHKYYETEMDKWGF